MPAIPSVAAPGCLASEVHLTSTARAIRPIVTNNLNLIRPAGDDPTLMTFDEVETLYHEFGHGLHGLLTTIDYARMSGVGGPRDYTEFPAQIMEHWAGEPAVLAEYARHYQTGEAIPQDLIDKMRAASTFNQGFKTTEYIAASLLDLRWHMLTPEEAADITDPAGVSRKQVLEEYGLIPEIEPRYQQLLFLAHLRRRLFGRLLCLSLVRDSGCRRLHRLQGVRRYL